ncbi:MAG: type I glyceraldehyde-3-phosphate dehydrogenase [Hyphomicrobiales bacterium]
MAVRVAINGFGRIGRNILRAIAESKRNDIEVVGINDLCSYETAAHLFKYDSVHGPFHGDVTVEDGGMDIGSGRIACCSERNPADLPWGDLGVDVALECTGFFTSKETASGHLDAGAKKVLVSAPASGADMTVVYGVNHDQLEAGHTVVSNASCTTNCLAPVAKVLNDFCGIERGYMTTLHAYTSDQRLLDTDHSDRRRARAAALSLIPTSTGAARAVGLVLPELAGKLDGTAIRVPTPNVSLVDLVFVPGRSVTVDDINNVVSEAAAGPLKGVIETNSEELVSTDFNHRAASSTFDLTQTQIVDDGLVRVVSWYDNEWGFSNRMSDTAVHMGGL